MREQLEAAYADLDVKVTFRTLNLEREVQALRQERENQGPAKESTSTKKGRRFCKRFPFFGWSGPLRYACFHLMVQPMALVELVDAGLPAIISVIAFSTYFVFTSVASSELSSMAPM